MELQPQEGPKPHTKFSPGRAGVPSCPGGTPLTARSLLTHLSSAPGLSSPSILGRSTGLPGGEVTALVHRHRGAKELSGLSWWQ